MIIVRLSGGLGNQMFQYAAARRLAYFNGALLKLDVSHFGRNPVRTFALGSFNIQAAIASPKEVAWFNGREKVRYLKSLLHSLYPNLYWKWVSQRSGYFDPIILTLKGNVYLDGVWQGERYFRDIVPVLLEKLKVREELDWPNRAISEQIRQVESVSLHIERGD